MRDTTPDNYSNSRSSDSVRKPASTISWLGFSFSLFTLLTLCCGALLLGRFISTHQSDGIMLYSLLIIIDIPIGLLGFIFSIVGLTKAANRGGRKWIGTCGLIFNGLIILSLIAPLFIEAFKSEPDIKLPENANIEAPQAHGILLHLDGYQLTCYDNREQPDTDPYECRLGYSIQIMKELDVWFKIHNINKNEQIYLEIGQGTDYGRVSELLEALDLLYVKNYQFITSSKDS